MMTNRTGTATGATTAVTDPPRETLGADRTMPLVSTPGCRVTARVTESASGTTLAERCRARGPERVDRPQG